MAVRSNNAIVLGPGSKPDLLCLLATVVLHGVPDISPLLIWIIDEVTPVTNVRVNVASGSNSFDPKVHRQLQFVICRLYWLFQSCPLRVGDPGGSGDEVVS